MQQSVPITVTSHLDTVPYFSPVPYLRIGNGKIYNPYNTPKDFSFWFTVVDLADLSVPYSEAFEDNLNVPANLQRHLQPGACLVVSTYNAYARNFPQGDLYALLVSLGSGEKLLSLEQAVTQLGTSAFYGFSYIVAGTIGSEEPALEAFSQSTSTFLTFTFQWSDVLKHYLPARGPQLS